MVSFLKVERYLCTKRWSTTQCKTNKHLSLMGCLRFPGPPWRPASWRKAAAVCPAWPPRGVHVPRCPEGLPVGFHSFEETIIKTGFSPEIGLNTKQIPWKLATTTQWIMSKRAKVCQALVEWRGFLIIIWFWCLPSYDLTSYIAHTLPT